MALLADAAVAGKNICDIEEIKKHAAWFDSFKDKYTFTKENAENILKSEIGKTFVGVLEDAGVFKCTKEGRDAFMRFVLSV